MSDPSTEHEMLQARLRGWEDFFSGQPGDLPYRDGGSHTNHMQLNFAWTLGYNAAKESDVFKLMVQRADKGAEALQQLAGVRAALAAIVEEMTEDLKASDKSDGGGGGYWIRGFTYKRIQRWRDRLARLGEATP